MTQDDIQKFLAACKSLNQLEKAFFFYRKKRQRLYMEQEQFSVGWGEL